MKYIMLAKYDEDVYDEYHHGELPMDGQWVCSAKKSGDATAPMEELYRLVLPQGSH